MMQDFMYSYQSANYAKTETNIYYKPFHQITVQTNTDIFSYLAKDTHENKNLTCRNALLSLVNLYAQVTKKRPIFY